jgi:predicted permease
MAFLHDLRLALRGLGRARGFTTVVVLTLALGTGASSVMFSVLRAALLRPPPFFEPDRLVVLFVTTRQPGAPEGRSRWSYPEYRFLREHVSSFESIAAYSGANFNLTGYDEPELVQGESVSAGYFGVLGAAPVLGRVFTADEDSIPGAVPVTVMGHALWQRRFGGDSTVVGKAIRVNGASLRVVGILQPSFRGLSGSAELWIPLALTPVVTVPQQLTMSDRFHTVVARLRPGAPVARAVSEVNLVASRMQAEVPNRQQTPGAAHQGGTALLLNEARVDPAGRTTLLILFGAVAILLLIACANTANLLLVRAASRVRETVTRHALGADRWQLIRPLLAENGLLAVAGAGAGTVLALLVTKWVALLLPARGRGPAFALVGDFAAPRVDAIVLLFGLGLAILTALAISLAPAARAARTDPTDLLKGQRTTVRRRRILGLDVYGALSVTEIALALVLLAGAGVSLRSLWKIQTLPTGIEAQNLLTFYARSPASRYRASERPALVERLVSSIGSVRGVEGVAASLYTPFSSSRRDWVTPDYFQTLGIPLLAGRGFTSADRIGGPRVGVVNQTAARRRWPGESPIGKRLFGPGTGISPDSAVEIVGVVADTRLHVAPGDPVEPYLYLASDQFEYIPIVAVVVRSAVPLGTLVPALRHAVMAVDPDLPIHQLQTADELRGDRVSRRRLNAILLGAFAGVALAIASVGVYGVMAYTTAQRTHEFGIRISLGAPARSVFQVVLGRAGVLVGVGVVLGLVVALALTRVLTSQLYGVTPTDPATLIGASVILAAAAVVASYLPARRAARADPLTALRAE